MTQNYLLILLLTTTVAAPARGQLVDGHEVDPIDSRLAARWESHGLQPAARCTDGQFLRRLSLDLLGRIPTEPELEAFLQLPDRSAAIERMLGSQEFDEFWALNWTTQL